MLTSYSALVTKVIKAWKVEEQTVELQSQRYCKNPVHHDTLNPSHPHAILEHYIYSQASWFWPSALLPMLCIKQKAQAGGAVV